MEFEEKEKLRKLEQKEKELERKYSYDVKMEIDAEKAKKKIKKEKIKTAIATILLTGGTVFGTKLMGISLPIENIIGVFAIVNCYTIPMYFSSTKDAREKVAYVKEHNILNEIENDKVDIKNANMEIDYSKNNIATLEEEKKNNDKIINDDILTLENIEKKSKSMTRVRH